MRWPFSRFFRTSRAFEVSRPEVRSLATNPSPTTSTVVLRVTRLAVEAPASAARFLASCRLMPRLPVKTTFSPKSGCAGSASGFGGGLVPSCGHTAHSGCLGTVAPLAFQFCASWVARESGSPIRYGAAALKPAPRAVSRSSGRSAPWIRPMSIMTPAHARASSRASWWFRSGVPAASATNGSE